MFRTHRLSILVAVIVCSWQVPVFGADAPTAPAAVVKQLLSKDLAALAGKEVLMETVEYPPGGASSSHRHDAQVFVYVLQGSLTMQVAGGPLRTLAPGETFYESPNDIHVVSANASRTAAAKFLVFIVKDKGAPATRAVTPSG